MIYLSYDEYLQCGGNLEETSYLSVINKACGIIANNTHSRLDSMAKIPCEAKYLCKELVEMLYNNQVNGNVASRSQSAGEVSESETYKTAEDLGIETSNLVYDYLGRIKDDNGVFLCYRGCK